MFVVAVALIHSKPQQKYLSYYSSKALKPGSLVVVPLQKKEVLACVLFSQTIVEARSMIRSSDFEIKHIIKSYTDAYISSKLLETVVSYSNYSNIGIGNILYSIIPSFILKDEDHDFFYQHVEDYQKKSTQKNNTQSSAHQYIQHHMAWRLDYYKKKIIECAQQKTNLVVISPTIQQAESWYEQFSEIRTRLDNGFSLFVFHGKKTARMHRQEYKRLTESDAQKVIIITPAFLSLIPDDAIVITEHAGSPFYQQNLRFPINFRVLINYYVRIHTIPLFIADNMLRIQDWDMIEKQRIHTKTPLLDKIFDPKKISIIDAEDMFETNTVERIKLLSYKGSNTRSSDSQNTDHHAFLDGTFKALYYKSFESIKKDIAQGKNIFIFVPKKSLAPYILCKDCGKYAQSPSTGMNYSLYQQYNEGNIEPIYRTRDGRENVPAFDHCQFCNSSRLIPFGVGSSQIQQFLKAYISDVPIVVIDNYHTKSQKALHNACDTVKNHSGATIVVGTQKVLYSTNLTWDSVYITGLGPLLNNGKHDGDFDVLYLLKQIHERTIEQIHIQNRNNLETLEAIFQTGNYQAFIQNQLSDRQKYQYPPYGRIIHIHIPVKKRVAHTEYQKYDQWFKEYPHLINIRPHPQKNLKELSITIKYPIDLWNEVTQDPQLQSLLATLPFGSKVVIE